MALFLNPYKNYFFLSRQPWKWLYLKYVWATLFFVRLPIWFIFSLIPWMRPRASWTIKRTLLVKSLQELVPMTFNTGQFKETVRVNPQKYANNEEEVGLVWIDAVPQMIQGDIKQYAKTNRVSVVHVPAYWFGRRDPVTGLAGQPASLNEKVILNLHCKYSEVVSLITVLTSFHDSRWLGCTLFSYCMPSFLDITIFLRWAMHLRSALAQLFAKTCFPITLSSLGYSMLSIV